MSCPNLPEPIQRLGELASNLWWSWHPQAEVLFQGLDPALWERIGIIRSSSSGHWRRRSLNESQQIGVPRPLSCGAQRL